MEARRMPPPAFTSALSRREMLLVLGWIPMHFVLLPELLRPIADYRMLTYAIILILTMIITNNPVVRKFFGGLKLRRDTAGREA